MGASWVSQYPQKAKPGSVRSTNRASDQHVNEVNAMADAQSNQTRPENRVFLFLAVSRADMQDKPHREQVTAHNEREARSMLDGRFILYFAGRLPVQGAQHD
ncbi:host cell division inhibitor Icd-like protein [Salmonella enterica]|uniref:host cell division inhibitor Icd-like protein n=1 Tax=Salmonella enterica TaxID=28901 RepID=UPI003EDBC852